MKVAVMVIVGLVVMQIMIIGEEIVSLVSSTEFWKTMSWSMGLILVPLVNSSKQKLVMRATHDIHYTDFTGNNTPGELYLSETIPLDGWISKAKYTVFQVEDANANVMFFFSPVARMIDSNVVNDTQVGFDLKSTIENFKDHGFAQAMLPVRPAVFGYDANEHMDGYPSIQQNDVMLWVESQELFYHQAIWTTDQNTNTITSGRWHVLAEYTLIIANYNDNRKIKPKPRSQSFLFWIGDNRQTEETYIVPYNMRLMGTELYVFDPDDDTELAIGVGIDNKSGSLFVGTGPTVNSIDMQNESNQIIQVNSLKFGNLTSTTRPMAYRRFYTNPIYWKRGEPVSIIHTSSANFYVLTAQCLIDYQTQMQYSYELTFNDDNTVTNQNQTYLLPIKADMYVESIDISYHVRAVSAGGEEASSVYLYGLKGGEIDWNNVDLGLITTGAETLGIQNNLLKSIKFAQTQNSPAFDDIKCYPKDYYPQSSYIIVQLENVTGTDFSMSFIIKGRNPRKYNNSDVLNTMRSDIMVIDYNQGVMV